MSTMSEVNSTQEETEVVNIKVNGVVGGFLKETLEEMTFFNSLFSERWTKKKNDGIDCDLKEKTS